MIYKQSDLFEAALGLWLEYFDDEPERSKAAPLLPTHRKSVTSNAETCQHALQSGSFKTSIQQRSNQHVAAQAGGGVKEGRIHGP